MMEIAAGVQYEMALRSVGLTRLYAEQEADEFERIMRGKGGGLVRQAYEMGVLHTLTAARRAGPAR